MNNRITPHELGFDMQFSQRIFCHNFKEEIFMYPFFDFSVTYIIMYL